MHPLIAKARKEYHKALIDEGVLTIDASGTPSNADKSSRLSREIAVRIASALMAETHDKVMGQTSGAKFEELNMRFLKSTFIELQNLRPGKWHVEKLGTAVL